MSTARREAACALVLLTVLLLAVIAATTPWSALSIPVTGAVSADVTRDFTAAELARAQAYRGAVRWISYAALAGSLLLSAVLALTPLGARVVVAAGRPLGGGRLARVVAGTVVLTLATRLVLLPLSARIEAIGRAYGLSTRSWVGWLADVSRSYLLSTALLLLVLVLVVRLARRWPRRWWAPAALAAGALVLVVSFAYPLVVEPVFNRFTSLPAGPVRTDLLALAEREGTPLEDVLVADASRRTSTLNAYVSGYGATRRVVLYDTLLDQASEQEIRLIVAHELGHAAHGDVLRGTATGALGAAAGACALYLVLTSPQVQRRAGLAAGQDTAADPRLIAVALLAILVLTQLGGPVQMLVSRRVEARADVASLEATRDPAGFVAMQRRLSLANLSDLDPPPLVFALFSSHPTGPQRIALARTWARVVDVAEPPDLARRVPPTARADGIGDELHDHPGIGDELHDDHDPGVGTARERDA